MDYPEYIVTGRVLNAISKEGIYNLKVEAWDKDEKYNDLVGVCMTDIDGNFEITFDMSYFREYAPETSPDLFFKVYRAKEFLKSTEDDIIWNANQKVEVEILVELPAERAEGKDYVSSEFVFNATKFAVSSDFSGLIFQTGSKVKNSTRLATSMFAKTFSNFNINPLKMTSPVMDDVLGKDVEEAKSNFESKDIEVNEVLEYDPRLKKDSIKDIYSMPVNIKPGQKVNLYQENGKILYYKIVDVEKQSNADMVGKIEKQQKEIASLKTEIQETKTASLKKDKQIESLKGQLESIQKDQVEMRDILTRLDTKKGTDK